VTITLKTGTDRYRLKWPATAIFQRRLGCVNQYVTWHHEAKYDDFAESTTACALQFILR